MPHYIHSSESTPGVQPPAIPPLVANTQSVTRGCIYQNWYHGLAEMAAALKSASQPSSSNFWNAEAKSLKKSSSSLAYIFTYFLNSLSQTKAISACYTRQTEGKQHEWVGKLNGTSDLTGIAVLLRGSGYIVSQGTLKHVQASSNPRRRSPTGKGRPTRAGATSRPTADGSTH